MIRILAQVLRGPRPALGRPLAAALAAGAVALGGCSDSSGPEEPNYDEIDPIVFGEHVLPIFQASCNAAECHNSTDRALGLSLASYAEMAEGSRYGANVVPFEPGRSHLYLHLTGDIQPRMPLGRSPLSDGQIRFLERWIREGAKDSNQNVMYSGVTRKCFVACQGENRIAVIDLDTGLLARLIEVEAPHSVFVDPARRYLYVTRLEDASDNLHVYDADTYELVNTGRVGALPALMQTTPDGSQLWVTDFDADEANVHVLNPDTLEEIALFTRGDWGQPHGLAISSDGSRAYVSNILTDNVIAFTFTGRGQQPAILEGNIRLPDPADVHEPQQCVLSADESRLFVSALGSNKIYVLDTTSIDGNESTPATFTGEVEVGEGPWHLALSPSGNELWVANWRSSSVSVVDVSNPDQPVEVAELTPTHPADDELDVLLRPIGIGFLGNEVWVACANDNNESSGHHPPPDGEKNPGNVVVFDAGTRTVKYVAEVPNFARFVSFLP